MRGLIWVFVFFSASVFSQQSTFTCSLTDTLQAGDTLTVKVSIDKAGISGFAKLEVFVPAGFLPCCPPAPGASIVFTDGILKFIWMELPTSRHLDVVMRFVTDPRIYGQKELYGSFHYIACEQRTKEKIPLMTLFVNNKKKTDIPEHLLAIYRKKHPLPLPETYASAIAYRVQIGAFRKKVPNDILADFYSETGKIQEEYIDGWYKYTVGYFDAMPQAADFRENCGIPGAFVVKYVNGKRQ